MRDGRVTAALRLYWGTALPSTLTPLPPMLIPISCDAPVYHWPFATVGLIVANVAAYFATLHLITQDPTGISFAVDYLVLIHGAGLHPIQWFANMFMHADLMHLIGNMLFLWIFGLVVEGKLGWWKFLVVYLSIGVLQSAFTQLVMLAVEGPSYSLGASSAIYGIMAIAVLWAPKNEINCFYWFGFWFAGTADVPILLFALIYLAFDILGLMLTYTFSGSAMSTGLLHVTGAMVGMPFGIMLLKRKMVDCEGWDAFSLWRGHGSPEERDYAAVDAKIEQKKQDKQQQQLADATAQINEYLIAGNVRAAHALYQKLRSVGVPLELDRQQLLATIQGLHARQDWAASAPLMAEMVERFPAGSDPVRIKLAQVCVTALQKPARALELLEAVDFKQQPEAHLKLARKIVKKAKQLQSEGVFELEDEAL